MKAAFYTRTGAAAEVLRVGQTAPVKPSPGELLVRLHASGVNPSDTKARAGARGMPWPKVIPHSDGAGVVAAVGADVDPARLGQRIWLWNAQWQRPFGTAAEYLCLPATQTAELPENTGFAEGACLGIPAMTAHRCVFADGPVSGQTVLITGGAGRVARYAIQMAVAGGARVLATAGSKQSAALARQAGAAVVFSYRDSDAADRINAAAGGRVDRIIDGEFGANLALGATLIATNGVIAAYGSAAEPSPQLPFYPLMFQAVTLRMVLVYELPEAARNQAVTDINGWLRAGRLSHLIAHHLKLDDIVEAHQRVERPDRPGCVVLDTT